LKSLEKIVIFDMDGTLVDNTGLAVGAARDGLRDYYLARKLQPVLPTREQVRSLVGLPAPEYFARLLPEESRSQANCREILERVQVREEERLAAGQGRMFAGVPGVMTWLKKEGYSIGLASNCMAGYLEGNLAHVLDRAWFDSTACLAQRPTKIENVALVLSRLGAVSGVMVGDRASDVEAGRANGLISVGTAYGYGDRREILEADHLIGGIGELPDLLQRL
jgi:phosphoglycolate phosphatase-like HAD superfamily hydrolase